MPTTRRMDEAEEKTKHTHTHHQVRCWELWPNQLQTIDDSLTDDPTIKCWRLSSLCEHANDFPSAREIGSSVSACWMCNCICDRKASSSNYWMPLSCYDPVYDVGFCGATQTADSCTNESRSSYADCQLTHFLDSVYTPSVRRSGTIGKRVALWIVRLFVEAFDLFSKVLFLCFGSSFLVASQ